MLKLGASHVMLNTRYERDKRPAAPPPRPGHQDVTLYFGCSDVDAAYAHLQSKGVRVKPPNVTYYGMKQLTVADPDGFELCLQEPAGQ